MLFQNYKIKIQDHEINTLLTMRNFNVLKIYSINI